MNERSIKSARSFGYAVAKEYWKQFRLRNGIGRSLRGFSKSYQVALPDKLHQKARDLGKQLSLLEPSAAAFRISQAYATELPSSYRSSNGIYYTPISLVEKMLRDASDLGVDFSSQSVIDTSSGGAAFLGPLAKLMFRKDLEPELAVRDVVRRLSGIELDPFGAWLSQFVVDCALAELAPDVVTSEKVVRNIDALKVKTNEKGNYDYVVGNPPYGEIRSDLSLPDHYFDIIEGRSNKYHLFLKLAIMLGNSNSVIHQVTPTGYLGGRYSLKLRSWIESEACPIQFDLISQRTGVFESVQQEMVISAFRKNRHRASVTINSLSFQQGRMKEERIGRVPSFATAAWILPRKKQDVRLVKLFRENRCVLSSYGYYVHTGYVVPHRQQHLLSDVGGEKHYPLIWSAAIKDGAFDPDRAYKSGKARWFLHRDNCPGLITSSCILVKRTSSKEQAERIKLTMVPNSFVQRHGGFYVENHVNVILPKPGALIDIEGIIKLLGSNVIDRLFRCLSGTVTISASELEKLVLPDSEGMQMFLKNSKLSDSKDDLEKLALKAYGDF
jgi:adenine-specific DNA-methyltransferase